jgi:hypothetical protein
LLRDEGSARKRIGGRIQDRKLRLRSFGECEVGFRDTDYNGSRAVDLARNIIECGDIYL